MCYTFPVGEVDEKVMALMRTTKESLYKGIAACREGNRIGDIANAVQRGAAPPAAGRLSYSLILIGTAGGAAFDFAVLHQPVVMVHHQVRLNLLQGIENHTHHNQQRCAAEELGEVLAYAEATRVLCHILGYKRFLV